MKTRFITALFAAASLLAGCSKETTGPGDTDDSRIPITFTLATPGSEGVIYPRSATRATHDAAEYAVRQLTLLVYDATDTSAPKFLRKHDMTSDITLYDNGNGTYTIPGVTGNLVINAAMTPKSYNVTVEGTGAGDVTAADKATYNTDYTFTVTEDGN